MVIGICRLELALPGNGSLKGKRRVRQSLIDRARRKFNLAVAEVEALDRHQRLVLGAVCVSNDAVHANRALQRFVSWVEDTGLAVVQQVATELVRPTGLDFPLFREGAVNGDTAASTEGC